MRHRAIVAASLCVGLFVETAWALAPSSGCAVAELRAAAGFEVPEGQRTPPGEAALASLRLEQGIGSVAPPARISRVSNAPNCRVGNDDSFGYAISANGRFVAFGSSATNLVMGDAADALDLFVVDRAARTIEIASLTSTGMPSAGNAGAASISADGRFVAFDSPAGDLVPEDTTSGTCPDPFVNCIDEGRDIFVRDRVAGTTERASVATDGTEGNLDSECPSISADGRFVAFETHATTFLGPDLNGSVSDVFVRDRLANATELVSVSTLGAQAMSPEGTAGSYDPAISGDGCHVAFTSTAANLVPDDTNNTFDIFVRDRCAGVTIRASVASDGTEGNLTSVEADISDDGRFVAFLSAASTLDPADDNGRQDLFVHDRDADADGIFDEPGGIETRRVTDAVRVGDFVTGPRISGNGRFVAFSSFAPDLVPGDTNEATDLFVFDRETDEVRRVNVGPAGEQGDHFAVGSPGMSADGASIVFDTDATNLLPGDTNESTSPFFFGFPAFDVYVVANPFLP